MNQLVHIMKITKIMFLMIKVYREVCQRLKRRWWIRPVNVSRKDLSFHVTCFAQLKFRDEEHFFKATRMSVAKFNGLLCLVGERLQRFSMRKPISAEMRLGITLM